MDETMQFWGRKQLDILISFRFSLNFKVSVTVWMQKV